MTSKSSIKAAIIGAGPAGLMAAETLAEAGVAVTLYERKASPARKFLLAGRGGLNLSHTEPIEQFLSRYHPKYEKLEAALNAYPLAELREWCHALGVETFEGTSGRIFPKSMKASPLLRAWLRKLDGLGVKLETKHTWTGWDEKNHLSFETPAGLRTVQADITILALGGASWPHLGADGAWISTLAARDIESAPLRPSNCGFHTEWSDFISRRFAGTPLKRVAVSCQNKTVRGEIMITDRGVEGGAIYALSHVIRETLDQNATADIIVDLRPDMSVAEVAQKLATPRKKQSFTTYLKRTLNLTPTQIALLQEGQGAEPTPIQSLPVDKLAARIKALPITLTGIAPIDRAISSAGGLKFAELDKGFMLTKHPGTFAAGEMLDWEAPTGGYLLHACFATGRMAAKRALEWATEQKP